MKAGNTESWSVLGGIINPLREGPNMAVNSKRLKKQKFPGQEPRVFFYPTGPRIEQNPPLGPVGNIWYSLWQTKSMRHFRFPQGLGCG
jgi:hypothetical protein